MFTFYADKNLLSMRQKELVTSGSVNVYPVRFQFSADWEGLDRVAVFRAGDASVSVPLPESGECTIPWEVLGRGQAQLYAGVYGTRGQEVVLPTQWVYAGIVLEGTVPGAGTKPPPDGGAGTTDHRRLTHREDEEQHPIEAISGLRAELERIPEPVEALTNFELEELLT